MRSVLYRMHFSLEPRLLFCIPVIWSMIASEHAKQNTRQRTDTLSTAQMALTPQRRQEHICMLCLLPPWITVSMFFFFSLWKLSIGICATSSLSTWQKLSLIWEERTSTEKSTQPDWLEGISVDSFSWLHINTEDPNLLGCWAGEAGLWMKGYWASQRKQASKQNSSHACLTFCFVFLWRWAYKPNKSFHAHIALGLCFITVTVYILCKQGWVSQGLFLSCTVYTLTVSTPIPFTSPASSLPITFLSLDISIDLCSTMCMCTCICMTHCMYRCDCLVCAHVHVWPGVCVSV